jgi:deazaflavin-dependent oxidoreductase (nitroreductase family)
MAPMNRMTRLMMRAPIGLYRVGLGWLLGKRFLLLEHTGRRSGLTRRTVLEVVEIGAGITPVVVSGWGTRSDWYRNVTVHPEVWFTLGRHRVHAIAVPADRAEAAAIFDRYRSQHPTAAKAIGRVIGVSLQSDLDEAAEKLPVIRLVPRPEG